MNSEFSNSEPIKLSNSSYTILCHKIIDDSSDGDDSDFEYDQNEDS